LPRAYDRNERFDERIKRAAPNDSLKGAINIVDF